MKERRHSTLRSALAFLALASLVVGCGGGTGSRTSPLNASDVNLIFVVTPDLAFAAPGDIAPDTANLTGQGLQRALMMSRYLKDEVLGPNNVTAIHALAPMTHLQTDAGYPDMAALGSIQPFALLNQQTLRVDRPGTTYPPGTTYTANSFQIDVSYAVLPQDAGVDQSVGTCPTCTGLDFANTQRVNDVLVAGIIDGGQPGFYVFAAPWETISAMLAAVDAARGYGLAIPTAYPGPNRVHAIVIPPSGPAALAVYDAALNPSAAYPVLPAPVERTACTHPLQPYFLTARTQGVQGATIPANINTNQRVYVVRHAEAHPDPQYAFENGNHVAAGLWRSLDLGAALDGVISPDVVYSIDPSQWIPMLEIPVSYVRPSLTVLNYAIAKNLPYRLASSFQLGQVTQPNLAASVDFFFTGGTLSGHTVLLGWESAHIKPMINELLSRYGDGGQPLLPVGWPLPDYDTILAVTLDAQGNVTVENQLCEGIDSAALPETAPRFWAR
jgi:hypothetical protein